MCLAFLYPVLAKNKNLALRFLNMITAELKLE